MPEISWSTIIIITLIGHSLYARYTHKVICKRMLKRLENTLTENINLARLYHRVDLDKLELIPKRLTPKEVRMNLYLSEVERAAIQHIGEWYYAECDTGSFRDVMDFIALCDKAGLPDDETMLKIIAKESKNGKV